MFTLAYKLVSWITLTTCFVLGLNIIHETKAEDQKPTYDYENALYDKIYRQYNRHVLPITTNDGSVEVRFSLELQYLADLNEEEQVLYTKVWMTLGWNDPRLKWNASEYGGIQSIRIPASMLWIPDITLYNSHEVYHGGLSGNEPGYKPIVSNNGEVSVVDPTWLGSFCSIDLQDFPYDVQHCTLKFGSWTYSKSGGIDLKLNYGHPHFVGTTTNTFHHEFEITNYTHKRSVMKYECCPENYIDIAYTVDLKRRATFATHLMVAPSAVVTLMVPVVFMLPVDSPAKVTFGTGLLITETLLLNVLIDMMPTPHPTIPNIGIYHVTSIVLIATSLAISALVLNICSKGDHHVRMPDLVKTILPYLGKMLFVPQESTSTARNNNYNRMELSADNRDVSTPEDDTIEMIKTTDIHSPGCGWNYLAAIVDRICFIIFVIVVFVTTFAIGLK